MNCLEYWKRGKIKLELHEKLSKLPRLVKNIKIFFFKVKTVLLKIKTKYTCMEFRTKKNLIKYLL